MRKREFIKLYAEINNMELKKSSEDVEEFLETLKDIFKTSPKVVFKNFGIFEVRETKARKIFDPRNQTDIIHSKPRKYVKFRTSRKMEDIL